MPTVKSVDIMGIKLFISPHLALFCHPPPGIILNTACLYIVFRCIQHLNTMLENQLILFFVHGSRIMSIAFTLRNVLLVLFDYVKYLGSNDYVHTDWRSNKY